MTFLQDMRYAARMLINRLLSGALRFVLFGVQPRDPLTFALVPAVLTAVALTACLVPPRRASGVDPIVALRAE